METILMVIAWLSILAFIVGMIKPAFVKCKSRGKVALIYLGVFIACAIIGSSIMDSGSSLSQEAQKAGNKDAGQGEIPVLSRGDVYTFDYGNADVKITFDNIELKRIPNGGINLVFSLVIMNNSNETFFISNCDWKLLDSNKIEVEEAGIYEPMFEDFTPGTFFFTTVEPNIGKKEQVGYSVKEEVYYLSINGEIIGQLPLNQDKKK